jgi:hypothetical protein
VLDGSPGANKNIQQAKNSRRGNAGSDKNLSTLYVHTSNTQQSTSHSRGYWGLLQVELNTSY